MDRIALLARELELRSWLERDRRSLAAKRDDVIAFEPRHPVGTVGEPAQKGLDAPRTEVGRGAAGLPIDTDLLVLGSDSPVGTRLAPGFEPRDQRIEPGDRLVERGGCSGSGQTRRGR